jgi:hypothetical protein
VDAGGLAEVTATMCGAEIVVVLVVVIVVGRSGATVPADKDYDDDYDDDSRVLPVPYSIRDAGICCTESALQAIIKMVITPKCTRVHFLLYASIQRTGSPVDDHAERLTTFVVGCPWLDREFNHAGAIAKR